MTLRHTIKRWAIAGVLAALGVTVEGTALAQQGVLLPAIGSDQATQNNTATPPATKIPALPRTKADTTLPAATPPSVPDLPTFHLQGSAPKEAIGAPSAGATTPAQSPAACPSDAGAGGSDRYKNVPPVAILQRPGFFPIPPTGPGYYTLCNQFADRWLQAPPKYPYSRTSVQPQPFFDIDWRYLDNPKNTEDDVFDCLKRQRCGPDDLFLFTTGGEVRYRYEHQENARLSNATRGSDNNDDLLRLRAYADLYITENFRVFAEFLSATSPDYLLTPIAADRDRTDFLNLFTDIRTLEVGDAPVWVRLGRQELCYGSQRLISTLDWANTRRTFQGAKGFWHSKSLDIDAFVVNPVVPVGLYAGGSQSGFTGPDTQVTFAGLWNTYKIKPGTGVDLYYLMLNNDHPLYSVPTGGPNIEVFNTIGGRFWGDYNNWLWDFEGMSQFGRFGAQGQQAWSGSAGAGYYFKVPRFNPTFWLNYDYASGSDQVSPRAVPAGFAGPAGSHTFNQLFPFNHYYNWMDLVGRQNIHIIQATASVYPADWLSCTLRSQTFFLDSSRDFLYNSGGAGYRRDPTGRAGKSVGTEFDIINNIHIDNHQDILFSYSYLTEGRFLRQTATTKAGRQNPQFVYVQYSFRW